MFLGWEEIGKNSICFSFLPGRSSAITFFPVKTKLPVLRNSECNDQREMAAVDSIIITYGR